MKHSRLPPSKAYSWASCTASVKLIEDNDAILPKDGSKEADEGTRAHAYLTALLKPDSAKAEPDDAPMANIIGALIQFIRELYEVGDRMIVDAQVPLFYLPSERGTLDVGLVNARRIVILDLKYGVGVDVKAKNNRQLAIYAESQIRLLETVEDIDPSTPVILIIYQPRSRNDPTVVREWHLTRGELAAFCVEIERPAQDILAGRNLKFAPGEACKFCRAEGICTAKGTKGLKAIHGEDEPVDRQIVRSSAPPPASSLTREQRQRVLAGKQGLIAWLEAVEKQELAELMAGAPPLQFKLVEGKSNRAWVSEQRVAKLLLDHLRHELIYPPVTPEIISPAQAEKLLKGVTVSAEFKEEFASLYMKPKGKPTIVPIDDPRPALNFDPTKGLRVIPAELPYDLLDCV